jgi:hypothetical protein
MAGSSLLLLCLWYWFNRCARLRPRLRYCPEYGVYTDAKTGIHYCPKCLLLNRASILKEIDARLVCTSTQCDGVFGTKPPARTDVIPLTSSRLDRGPTMV